MKQYERKGRICLFTSFELFRYFTTLVKKNSNFLDRNFRNFFRNNNFSNVLEYRSGSKLVRVSNWTYSFIFWNKKRGSEKVWAPFSISEVIFSTQMPLAKFPFPIVFRSLYFPMWGCSSWWWVERLRLPPWKKFWKKRKHFYFVFFFTFFCNKKRTLTASAIPGCLILVMQSP